MDRRERVFRQIRGEEVDRIPLMGGWIQSADNLATLASLTIEEYLADPVAGVVKANAALGVDCVTFPLVPMRQDEIRIGHILDESFAGIEPEHIKRDAEAVPDTDEGIIAAFNTEEAEAFYRKILEHWTGVLGDILLIATTWNSVPNFMMYCKYGYQAYFLAIAMYPEHVGRLYHKSAIEARQLNYILMKLMREYKLPPIIFTGHDICSNTGPMCSMEFLHQYYFAEEKYALEPLVDAGIRVVRHCDGNVMPLIDNVFDQGYSGFQGFQYECGIDPFAIAEHTGPRGEPLLFLAGMNVTRSLPFGTPADVRDEIDYAFDYTQGGRGLFLFSSNGIGPEVPLENIRCAYEYAASIRLPRARAASGRRPWPWLAREAATTGGKD